MIMKLCMEHYELKLYTVYINDDPELDLDLFYSNAKCGETCFCTYSRPRYQVSFYRTNYRTIGPLVYSLSKIFDNNSIVHAGVPQSFAHHFIEKKTLSLLSQSRSDKTYPVHPQ